MIKKYYDFGTPLIIRHFFRKALVSKHDDADNDHLTPLRKNRKSLQKCKDSHHNQWPCIHSSQKVECRIHCSVCKTDFSCKYSGKNVCQRHIESKTHQQLL